MQKFLEGIAKDVVEKQKDYIKNSVKKIQDDINNNVENFTRETIEKQKVTIKNLIKQKQQEKITNIKKNKSTVEVSVQDESIVATKAIEKEQKEEQPKDDLEIFLSKCSNEELSPLVDILTQKSNNALCKQSEYINYAPDHKKYFNLIAKEICLYGSNTIANIKRGGVGVPYNEVVYDVCELLGVPCVPDEIIQNEQNLLELGALDDHSVDKAIKAVLKRGVLNWALFGGIGVLKVVSDPAYSVTVPCVVHIANLRKQKFQSTKCISHNSVPQNSQMQIEEDNLNNCLLTITNSNNDKVLSLAEINATQDIAEWQSLDAEYKGISKLNPLLQVLPSLAIAGNVKTTKLMEVVIKGDLINAIGGGFRATAKGADGKIIEQARLFDPTKLSSLVNAAALFQVASMIVAQKHLADISAKLTEIKASVKTIELFQANERKSKIIGAIEYFEQVAPSVLNGNHSQSFLNQIEAKENELLSIQNHLIEDIKQLNLDRDLANKDTFGSAGLMKEIEEYQEKILTHHKQLLQCIRARGCGWQLLSAFPEFPHLVINRKKSILKILDSLRKEELLEKSEQAIRYNIKKLDSIFNSSTTLGARKLELLQKNKYILSDVSSESLVLENTLLGKNSILSDIKNPEAKMIVKIENGEIVAVSI